MSDLKAFKKELKSFDKYYEMSDDQRAWRQGFAHHKKLQSMLDDIEKTSEVKKFIEKWNKEYGHAGAFFHLRESNNMKSQRMLELAGIITEEKISNKNFINYAIKNKIHIDFSKGSYIRIEWGNGEYTETSPKDHNSLQSLIQWISDEIEYSRKK